MAHSVNHEREYRLLQQRYDRNVTGAPASPIFLKILSLLFSPEEARLARQIPTRPISVWRLARRLKMDQAALDDRLTAMAERGLIFDFYRKERRYVTLPPVVIGFFEFTFMRAREGLPMRELAALFDAYMYGDERFAHSVFQGETQIGRSLVREEALPAAGELPDGEFVEILDYERASHIVESASAVGVSLCACRHKAQHLEKACERPQRTCLTFDGAATGLIRNGIAEPITRAEAREIIATCKEAGLAQTGDNVRHKVSYICNCCGCCCGMMQAIRRFDIRNAIVTSNWLMQVDAAACNGCGLCARACPVAAITIREERLETSRQEGRRRRTRRRWAEVDPELCLGCGTCHGACKFDAVQMVPRVQRVYTPEHTVDRMLRMAVERGRLANLLFDEPERVSARTVGQLMHVLEQTPPLAAARAIAPLRSTFLDLVVAGANRIGISGP